jgi:hypothetical protein
MTARFPSIAGAAGAALRHCSRYSRVIRIHRNALRIERWIYKSHSALSAAAVLRNSVFRRRKCLYFCYRDV